MKHQRKICCRLLPVLTQAEKRQNCQDYDDSADEIDDIVHVAVSIDDWSVTQLKRNWFPATTMYHLATCDRVSSFASYICSQQRIMKHQVPGFSIAAIKFIHLAEQFRPFDSLQE
jgi:hypothetical protein